MTDLIPYSQARITQVQHDMLSLLDSEGSRRVYRLDLAFFADWMHQRGLTYQAVTASDMIAYRAHLAQTYKKVTAQRMFTVVRRLFKMLVSRGVRPDNPCSEIKGFVVDNESTHIALKREQAKQLLDGIDTRTVKGKRDYAIVVLLLRTGLRRAECTALTVGDLQMREGHHVAIIQHGKGDKRRIVKIPVDVFRSLEDYIIASGRTITSLADPLFIGFDRRPRYAGQAISTKGIERIVKDAGERLGYREPHQLTPHDLRATFITLAKEGGATLEQRQYVVGHSDPRTTQRYDRRKLNLDDNAVDHIHL